jgi:pimeloyl-ACP methyl ester carboxylesterase
MHLVFVHGWSVRSTATYGNLPDRLAAATGLPVEHVHLGKYVSFDDAVTLDDLALAFEAALTEKGIRELACITHSTGGPLVRHWLSHRNQHGVRLRQLVMLAPANHGSALAQLGKGRLGRIKAFFESIEPGQKILDWLELGSEEQWKLNKQWLDFGAVEQGCFPFVLSGEAIDRKLYDHLNSYTGEPGGDGVVRQAAAHMNN